jgi:[acyl-carrier-protein] S-malonyltransferase
MAIAFVFPGQGSQFAGMADPWAKHPAGRRVLQEASETLGRDIVAGCRDDGLLATTEFVQPAILACDIAAFRVLEEGAQKGDHSQKGDHRRTDSFVGVAGHSLGEFAALVASGTCELAPVLQVVVARGLAMQRAGETRAGAMSALLGVGAEQASELCDRARGSDVHRFRRFRPGALHNGQSRRMNEAIANQFQSHS